MHLRASESASSVLWQSVITLLPMHSTSWTKCSRSSCVSVSRPCLGQRRPPSLSETEAQQLYMQFADELLDVIKIIKQRRARIMGDDDEGGSMMG